MCVYIYIYIYIIKTCKVRYCDPQSQTDYTHVLLPSQVSQYNKPKLPARFKDAVCAAIIS